MKTKLTFLFVGALLLGLAELCGAAELFTRSVRPPSGPRWAPNEIIVKFRPTAREDRIAQINQRRGTSVLHSNPFAGFKRIKVPAGKTAEQMVQLYNSEAEVDYAELNYYAYALFAPNDPFYYYQWHFDDTYKWTGPIVDPDRQLVDGTNPYGGDNGGGINLEPAWDITTGEPNVIVAIVDTGVAYENYGGRFGLAPDLANTNFVAGYNFVKNNEHANDDDGHGTHVTGTIAQSTNNGLGIAGIAFNCSIMPVKVLANRGPVSSGSHADIASGIYFATDNGAAVINMSLGGPSGSTTLVDALEYAYNNGVTIICSAGNNGAGGPPSYPAAYDAYCIAVGATRYDEMRSSYSTTGSYVDIAAPGGEAGIDQNGDGYGDGILQQTFDKNPKDWGYWFYSGTSMAAAHVSGVAALLISTGVTGPDAVREALEVTAEDLGPVGWDIEYGWGLLDAYAALSYYQTALGDLDGNGSVDLADLEILTGGWLQNAPVADIVPPGGDGIVNFLDYAGLAQDYMQ